MEYKNYKMKIVTNSFDIFRHLDKQIAYIGCFFNETVSD